MHVGQVEFAVLASGLDDVLSKVTQLESKLNHLDTKKFDVASKAITKQEADAAKQAAKQQRDADRHAESVKKQNYYDARTNAVEAKQLEGQQRAVDRHAESVKKQEVYDAQAAKATTQKNIAENKEIDRKADRETRRREKDAKIQREWSKAYDDYVDGEVKRIRQEQKNAKATQDAANKASSKAIQDENAAYERRVTRFAHLGERLESLGNAMQSITSPFTQIYTGFLRQAGYQLFGTLTQGLKQGFSRYDTMRMYPKMMAEYSKSSYTAKQSVNDLRDSVLGLPTGLDEITDMAQRYTLSLGDMKRGTNLAIATNRAFIASMATEMQRYQGMLQLQDLMNGKELQPKEWMSLGASMGKAINEIAKTDIFGAKTQKDIKKFRQDLYAGKIDTDKFLKALEQVGTKGGAIYKLSNKMKDTYQALQDNIVNANARLIENTITSLDEVFKAYNGKNLLKNMQEIPKYIDSIGDSLQSWVKANPDKISKMFDTITSIDWKGILQGVGEFTSFWGDVIGGMMKFAGGKNFARFMLWGNVAGKGLTLLGQFIRGFAPALAKIKGGGVLGKIGDLARLFTGIGEAGEAAEKASLSWKDVGMSVGGKAVGIAAFPAIAWSIKEAAKALEVLNDVKMDFSLIGKVALIGSVLTALVMAAGSIGAALASNPVGWAVLAGTGVTALSFDAIAASVLLMAEAVDKIAKIEIPSLSRVRKVAQAFTEIGTIFSAKDPLGSFGKMIDAWSRGSQAKALKSFIDSVKGLSDIGKLKINKNTAKKAIKSFEAVYEVADSITGLFEVGERDSNGHVYGYRLKNTAKQKSNIKSYETLSKQVGNYAEMIGNLSTAFLNMRQLVNRMKKFQNRFSTITSDSQKSPLDFGILRGMVEDVATAIYELGKTDDSGFSPLEKLKKASQQIQGAEIDQLTTAFDNIPNLVKSMWDVYRKVYDSPLFKGGEVPALSTAAKLGAKPSIKNSPLGAISNMLGTMFQSIGGINEAVKSVGGAKAFSESIGFIKTAISGISGVITEMQTLSTTGAENAKGINAGGIDTISESISTFVTKLNNALGGAFGGGASGLSMNVSTLMAAVRGVKDTINELNNIPLAKDMTSVVTSVTTAVQQLQSIGTKIITINVTVQGGVIDLVSAKIVDVANAIQEALDSIQSKYEKSISVKIYLAGLTDTVSTAIANASRNIWSAWRSVPTNLSKNVNVHIGLGSISKPTLPLNLFPSTGGLIGKHGVTYRQFGGFVPRGTDTVPAMLTPGEYVLNRNASNVLGTEVLQRLNHLDIRGAITALATRAGRQISPNVVNNTRNEITINNHTPSSDVGLTRASRWVKQLG